MTPIWKQKATCDQLNRRGRNTMVDHLGIIFEEIGPDYLVASMPVDERTIQPLGLLHGGASVVLAETVGSVAGALCVDLRSHYCVGIEVNANHLRAVRSGRVTAMARPLFVGRKIQVWQIDTKDDQGKPVTASRLTLAVLDHLTPDDKWLAWLTP
ncbi:MAG: hotdog fold thioesterase [Bacteroidota bacterium]|nr:hotdog fold thioesterase [Bacteroidota bacterium]MDE2835016.1 hotdog fold thioesterase [Bacteroidota bacterium]